MSGLIEKYVSDINGFSSNIKLDTVFSTTRKLISFTLNYRGGEYSHTVLYQAYPDLEQKFQDNQGIPKTYDFSAFIRDIFYFLSENNKDYSFFSFASMKNEIFPYTIFQFPFSQDQKATFLKVRNFLEDVFSKTFVDGISPLNQDIFLRRLEEVVKSIDIKQFIIPRNTA